MSFGLERRAMGLCSQNKLKSAVRVETRRTDGGRSAGILQVCDTGKGDENMAETVAVSGDAVCPGCHFRCKLVKYQCGRGKEFFEMAATGEQLPERRGPVLTPSERASMGGAGKPPVNGRVMHGLNVMGNVIKRELAEDPQRKVVQSLARGGSFMSLPILANRTHLAKEELRTVIDELVQAGLVVEEREEHAGLVARLTDKGAGRAVAWRSEHDERVAEFLSPLTDEEKEQLATMLRKLFPRR